MYLLVWIGFVSLINLPRLGLGQMEKSNNRVIKSTESVRGYPCIKRLNQLYCPSPGRGYPSDMHKRPQITQSSKTSILHSELFADEWIHPDSDEGNEQDHEVHLNRTRREAEQVLRRVKRDLIDMYIDENKALIKRMFGEYSPPSDAGEPDNHIQSSKVTTTTTYDGSRVKKSRGKRSHKFNDNNKVDTCESAVEIVTPYWASNSAGKIRAIVNTQHLQQAIQQEVCQSVETKRCRNECSCEQKYKWHRLLAYDPDDDCKGIFMDWFLFPSCCVCRCNKNPLTTQT